MNYIKEINAFYNHLEFNALSNSAILLWHVLMQINNKTGWKKEFIVAAKVLVVKAQLTDSTFKRAREELVEKGYIRVQSRGGNLAASYEMISLTFVDHNNDYNKNDNSLDQIPDQNVTRSMDHRLNLKPDHNVIPLIKQEENKNKNKKDNLITTTTPAEAFYEENFEKIPPYIKRELLDWVSKVGETLVMEAMKRALENNHGKWNYVRGILKKWQEKGLKSVEQVEADERAFKERRDTTSYGAKSGTQEVIPDGFYNWGQRTPKTVSSGIDAIALNERISEYLESKKAPRVLGYRKTN